MSRRKSIQLEVSLLGNGTEVGRGVCGAGRSKSSRDREGALHRVARSIAEKLAMRSALRGCTVDDVLGELARHRIHAVDLGSSLGTVFRARLCSAHGVVSRGLVTRGSSSPLGSGPQESRPL